MTNVVNQTNQLITWWENVNFPEKQFCHLLEDGSLLLKKTENYPEKVLLTLTIEQADAALKALIEKFPEVAAKVKEVETELAQTEDKLKLVGKVSRLKDYLLHTNAIGDFEALMVSMKQMEHLMNHLIEQNYAQKLAITLSAEEIAENSTNWKEDTLKLKSIGDEWRNIGHLDKHRNEALWNRLEVARNKFFERKRAHQDEQEKEMMRNLDLKMELVEKAESIADAESWKETTEIFKNLMDTWRTIGRTVHDKNEELWNRFILAKNKFYERKRVHFEVIQGEQEKNLLEKLALVEQAESIKDSTDWSKTSTEFAEILEKWKSVGKVPIDKAEELWNRMSVAKETFFNNKRQFLQSIRVEQEDNYAQKLSLLKRAESIKNSTNWRETTEEMNELLTEWKKIGQVPREFIHSLWEQFLAARKHFFNRKDEDREKRKLFVEKQIQGKFQKTKSFLEQLEQELEEEKARLEDFKGALGNVSPGNKEDELKSHLEKLISQTEFKIKHKISKIEDLRKQVEDLEKMNAPKPNVEKTETSPTAGTTTPTDEVPSSEEQTSE